MRRVVPLLLFVTSVSVSSFASAQAAKPKKKITSHEEVTSSSLLVGGAALIEAGRFDQSTEVNRLVDAESDEVRDFGGGLVLGYLHGLGSRFRLGGSLTYSGLHRLSVVDGNDDEKISFGQRLALDLLAEGVIPVSERMDVLVGGRLGTPILIPGGDFEEIVRTADAQQYSTNLGPRFGLRIGVDVDARFHVKEHFAVRVGAGYAWSRTWLMNAKAESELFEGRRKYSLSLSQVRIGAGVEWLF